MVVVNIDIKYLEGKTRLKKEKIKEVLENLGFPTEIEENEFWIEITPDRPDCYFVSGIIRTIDSFVRKKNKKYTAKKSKYKIIVDKSVKKVRPYISSCVIKNLKISEKELEQLIDAQEKIHETFGRKRKKIAVGIHNLDVIEFPIRYKIVREYNFVPLEFSEKMSMEDIMNKHPKGIEYAHLVEKGKYPLIYEEKSGRVVSFPPIINEERTKLDEKTKNIFIELTGIHKETVENAVTMLACALVDMGGELYEVKINNESHPKLKYKKEKIDVKRINKLLGTELKKSEINNSLEKTGYFVKGNYVEIPPYRSDMIEYVDLIEDVAIGYGYDKFEPTIPNVYTSGKYSNRTKKEREIREIMNGLGFLEVVTPILVGESSIDKKKAVRVVNPCSVDCSYIREDPLNSLMVVLESNKMKGLPQRIYEIGVGYKEGKEKQSLVFMVMDKKVDFNYIRGYTQRLMREWGKELVVENYEDKKYKKGRCVRIIMGGEKKGVFGELKKEYLEKKGINFEVGYFEVEI